MGRLPLVPGMPVILTQNYDVEGGIVNGSRGILKKIRYSLDENGLRRLISCVVKFPGSNAPEMCGLGPKNFPVLQETANISVTHK
ncbi:hypothetical protein AURDEDRAFT_41824, partial [Auricularia subglabra TFB-10046 SS5]